MKAFLKKHRFKIAISLLVIILIYVSFYMLWVHVPYAAKQNELIKIREELCYENDYTYDDYFNEYHNDKTYYIIKVKKKKKSMYVVFNEKKKKIETYDGSFVKKSEVKTAFENKYGVASTKTEIGYENGEIAYCLTYKGNDTLIYAFYAIDDGEFIKAYRLEPDA